MNDLKNMTFLEIKHGLEANGHTFTDVANIAGVSVTQVHRVAKGSVSDPVRRVIAQCIGKNVKEIWPEYYSHNDLSAQFPKHNYIKGGPRQLNKFSKWYDNRHEYAKEWKERTGGKVLGYFCTYVPEEILYAADILPVRILGSHEQQSVTEPHIFGMYCPFCRDCLAQGLKGRYDYLDGIMIAQACMHIRQTYNSWKIHIPVDYHYYLYMPVKVQDPSAHKYLANELKTFKKSIEEWTGKVITNQDLEQGIEVMNRNRRLMKQVYELRKKDSPPITGHEAMYLTASSQMVDKNDHSQEIERILPLLEERDPGKGSDIRLMIVGSENDDIKLIETIESLGISIVIDDHCTGSRYFWNEVVPDGDEMMAIAKRYVDRVPCPSKDWERRDRFVHILNLAEEWNVQGAILIQQKFCDPHEFDLPPLKKALEDQGIKCYDLEIDATNPLGPIKIRMEAFVEMLNADALFF